MKLLPAICITLLLFYTCKKNSLPAPSARSSIQFSPAKGAANYTVEITGHGFGQSKTGITVTFNNIPVTVNWMNDSVIDVITPANVSTGKIAVTVKGKKIESDDDFTVLTGTWTNIGALPAPGGVWRAGNICVMTGDHLYYGFGRNNTTNLDDLWQYNFTDNTWVQKKSLGLGLLSPVAVVVNDKLYVGFGTLTEEPGAYNHFFEYDPVTDTWTEKADFPGPPRDKALAAEAGGKMYAGLGHLFVNGSNSIVDQEDWYEYDAAADKWVEKQERSNTIDPVLAFSFNGSVYLGGGYAWFMFNPFDNSWMQRSNYPLQNSYLPTNSVVFGNKAYLTGYGGICWEYLPAEDTWTQKAMYSDRGQATALFTITAYTILHNTATRIVRMLTCCGLTQINSGGLE